jgi:CRISPR-associated protein Cmr6
MCAMPLYQIADRPRKTLTSHKGLWFERFFDKYDRQWQMPDGDKKTWIDSVTGSCGNESALKLATKQQEQLCRSLGGEVKAFKAEWHFATGLGNAHPVENGFAWHPTLGTPYLSGASVKGLVRAYIETWAGLEKSEIREVCRHWFGSESKDPKEQNKENPSEAGAYIFFDAIPLKPVTLACDIMTPHMGDWYAKGDHISDVTNDSASLPADWHNPVPIPFLVVKEGSFLFSIASRNPHNAEAKAELSLVIEALGNALEYMGAGAKTAAGYGRMTNDDTANKAIEKSQKEAAKAEMPIEERFRVEFQEMDDKKLAEMFDKHFNKTKAAIDNDHWVFMMKALRSEKIELIRSWEHSEKKSERGAFNKLSKEGLFQ